jgi:hypothetical protein
VNGSGFSLRPGFEGTLEIEQVPSDFFERIERRIAEGLLVPGKRTRANYRVTSASRDRLTFVADDFAAS